MGEIWKGLAPSSPCDCSINHLAVKAASLSSTPVDIEKSTHKKLTRGHEQRWHPVDAYFCLKTWLGFTIEFKLIA